MSADQQKPASSATDPSMACEQEINPAAPAGARSSLGAKSDCNGRPATDDSVVEAVDEQGPLSVSNPRGRSDGRS